MLEALEDRSLMTTASLLAAHNDGPFTVIKNTPITINVVANDTTQNPGTLALIELTIVPGVSATPDTDNLVTLWFSNAGSYVLPYTVTDGTDTATANLYVEVVPSASELYAAYLVEVALADQLYLADATVAATNRQAAGADVAAQLHDDYLGQFSVHEIAYQEALLVALEAYEFDLELDGVLALDRYQSADDTFEGAVEVFQSDWEEDLQASEIAYGEATSAAEVDYLNAIAPYQAALESAQANVLANPEDPAAQLALTQAEQDLADAELQAAGVRDIAYADALTAPLAAEELAGEIYETAIAPAAAIRRSEIAGADQDFTLAEEVAYADAVIEETEARLEFVAAEQADWDEYLNELADLNAEQPQALAQHEASLALALNAWTNREGIAWNIYVTALTAIEAQPAMGQRAVLPPPNVVGAVPPLAVFNALFRNDPAVVGVLDSIDLALARARVLVDPFVVGANVPAGLLGLPNGNRATILGAITRIDPATLPRKPDRWPLWNVTGGSSRRGIVPPGTLVGPWGTATCVGVLLIPFNPAHETFAYHFSFADSPAATFSRDFPDATRITRTQRYRAVLCGAEVRTGVGTAEENANSARTLKAVVDALTTIVRVPASAYVPGPSMAVDQAGQLYWTAAVDQNLAGYA